jgi:molybdopterin synthase sulfur carrier subunit
MKITVKFAAALSRYTQSSKIAVCDLGEKNDMASLIEALDAKFPGIKKVLCDESFEIADSINIYVNGDNIRYVEGFRTPLKENDQVNIIPAAAAG